MNQEFSFMHEKIKDKPFYKKKWVRLLAMTIFLAIVFGLIASAVFIKVTDWQEQKREQEAITEIEIPKDAPEDMETSETPVVPETTPSQNQDTTPETIVVDPQITKEDYMVLYANFRGLAKEAQKSLVTVTAVNHDVDWFNEEYQNRGQCSGLIIGDNGVELLVLTKYQMIESCDGINVTFVDETSSMAALKKYDVVTNLAVISINLSDISESTREKIQNAALGSSIRLEAGSPVLAIGRADGSEGSMKVGMLTSARNKQSVIDAEYTILVTDMLKNAGADGILINLNGEVVGIMQEQHSASNMQNVLTAYGVSDIKGLLEHLSNNQDIVYLGIKGTTVTKDALDAGVPEGVYITEVEMNSPAMKAGIQKGDVIQAVNGQKITTMPEYSDVLSRLSNRQNITLEGRRLTKDGYKKVNYQASLSVLE